MKYFKKNYLFSSSNRFNSDYCVKCDYFAPLLAAAIPAVASLAGSAISMFGQQKANAQNQANYQQNFDYNAAVQQKTWEREDTQAQRAVADYTKAGFSPLAAVGQGVSSTPISQSGSAGIQSVGATAGDMINNLGTSIAQMSVDYKKHRETLEAEKQMQERQIEATGTENEKQRKFAEQENERDRSATRDNLIDTLDNQKQIAQMSNDNSYAIAMGQLSEQIRANNAQEALQAQKATEEWINSQLKDYPGAKPGKSYDDFDSYSSAMDKWSRELSVFLEFNSQNLQTSESSSTSSSSSGSASANIGSLSVGSVSASGSKGSSASGSKSYNQDRLVDNKLKAFLANHPMPILKRSALYN